MENVEKFNEDMSAIYIVEEEIFEHDDITYEIDHKVIASVINNSILLIEYDKLVNSMYCDEKWVYSGIIKNCLEYSKKGWINFVKVRVNQNIIEHKIRYNKDDLDKFVEAAESFWDFCRFFDRDKF